MTNKLIENISTSLLKKHAKIPIPPRIKKNGAISPKQPDLLNFLFSIFD
jgi:uncharacterized membrane protein YagU involved in acid resistance